MKLNIDALRAALAQPKTAIHCDTKEKELALNRAVGRRIIDWALFGKTLCVMKGNNHWGSSSKDNYLKQGYTILALDDYILPDKPRLAEVLGVEVGQEFKFDWPGHEKSRYRITAGGYRETSVSMGWCECNTEGSLALMINNPHLIRILPRWTEDDIADAGAAMRIFPECKWAARDMDGDLWLFKGKPTADGCGNYYEDDTHDDDGDDFELPPTAFPSVTWENSPVKLEEIK